MQISLLVIFLWHSMCSIFFPRLLRLFWCLEMQFSAMANKRGNAKCIMAIHSWFWLNYCAYGRPMFRQWIFLFYIVLFFILFIHMRHQVIYVYERKLSYRTDENLMNENRVKKADLLHMAFVWNFFSSCFQ